jgi:hypothetical protein
MAQLSKKDKEVLYGPNWREIDAQIEAEAARKREQWKRFTPVVVAVIAAGLVLVAAAEAFF